VSGERWDQRRWQRWLLDRLTALLGHPVTERDVDRPLSDCGLSSRDAVTLIAEIGQLSGKEVPSTLVWSAPTITALSRALVDAVEPDDHVPAATTEPVAVVGLACRLPGAPSAAGFWSLLRVCCPFPPAKRTNNLRSVFLRLCWRRTCTRMFE